MFLCCARTIMAMTVALLLASGSTTEGLAVQAIKTSVSESSQFQLSASKDGDALFRPPPLPTLEQYIIQYLSPGKEKRVVSIPPRSTSSPYSSLHVPSIVPQPLYIYADMQWFQ